jgi:hypothetical protein
LSGCVSTEQEDVKEVIFVDRASLALFFGDTEQLTASPTEATFNWSSEDEAVAKVSATGFVEAVGVGSTRIVVTHDDVRTYIPLTVTIPGLDKVTATGGFKRVLLDITAGDKIKSVKISHNGSSQPIIVTVAQAGLFTQEINGLDENTYTFTVVAIDKYDNEADPTELKVKVYGDDYVSNFVRPRTIQSFKTTGDNNLSITWQPVDPANGALYTELVYTAVGGTEKTLVIPTTDVAVELSDYLFGQEIKHRTFYLAIDPVSSDLQTVVPAYVPLNKLKSSVVDFSSEITTDYMNGSNNAINGLYDYRWYTKLVSYPHYITVDLGVKVNIGRFGVWPSTIWIPVAGAVIDPNFPSKVRFEVSLDNVTWTDLGEFDCNNSGAVAGERRFDVTPTPARFFRFTGLECSPAYNTYMTLSELDVYCM